MNIKNKKASDGDKNPVQKLSTIKGRAMLEWYGKRAPRSIDWFPAQEKEVYGDIKAEDFNKLFWGDNKQVLSHLLKEYRGKVDLIYIDPPFDSKADYIKKVKLNGQKIDGVEQNVLEEMQYTDMWEKDEYLQFMYERLIVLRELLSDTGSIYLHCDWHKNSHLRLLMDEVFGEQNYRNEIVWHYGTYVGQTSKNFPKKHDTLLLYSKDEVSTFHPQRDGNPEADANYKRWKKYFNENNEIVGSNYPSDDSKFSGYVKRFIEENGRKPSKEEDIILTVEGKLVDSVWDIQSVNPMAGERTDYPTQKPEELIERVIKATSNKGDLVMDCFSGSGTTLAVAEKLGRRWIGCDINKGAIITTTERLNKIITKKKDKTAFKVYNVNHYDVFNNDLQAKQLLIEIYKIDELSRGDFDGTLGDDYVKIISPNRVLSKMDIAEVIDAIKKGGDLFTAKATSKQKENTFENKVIVICSGAELDVRDYAKKENKTGVEIEIRDIQTDKKELDFKKPTEANISYNVKDKALKVEVKDYYSPLLMKRLELENEGRLSMKERVNVFDFRQAIEHIVIDVNYGEGQKKSKDIAFNAEVFLHKEKKNELVDTSYSHTYEKKGAYTVAVKIVDVLGEEYFETHEITVK
jgi:site-specific DNA-methyltransferase (adenine-specific)/adenine-specific DNA-methyltransferase